MLRTTLLGIVTLTWSTTAAAADNVLLIIADDIGVDKLDRYSSDIAGYIPAYMPDTPTLDDLSDAGLRFTNAWANPVCSPTRAGIFTGQHGFNTGVGHPGKPEIPVGTTTIADVLSAAGVTNGIFGKWHNGDANSTMDSAAWEALAGSTWTVPSTAEDVDPLHYGWDHFAGTVQSWPDDYWAWPAIKQNAAQASGRVNNQTGPWMATVAFNAPHEDKDGDGDDAAANPGGSGDGWDTNHARCSNSFAPLSTSLTDIESYQAAVECMDGEIANLLGSIDLTDTLIVFVGDNGTHNEVAESPYKGGAGRGKGSTYETGIRVPFIVTSGDNLLELWAEDDLTDGDVVSPGRHVDHPVHTMDLYQTLTEVLTGTAATSTDSVSFADYLTNPSASWARTFVYTEEFLNNDGSAALRGATYKLRVAVDSTTGCTYELFDIDPTVDPFEANDLAGSPSTLTIQASLRAKLNTLAPTWMSGLPNCP